MMPAVLSSFESSWRSRPVDALRGLRAEAMAHFLRLGLPTTRDESWRYTNLRFLGPQRFVDAPTAGADGDGDGDAAHDGLQRILPASMSALGSLPALCIVNGRPASQAVENSNRNGLHISRLSDLSYVNSNLIIRALQPLSDDESRRFALLNTALFVDGLYIKVDSHLDAPLLLVHVAAGGGANSATYPRIIVEAAPGSRATVIELHVGPGEQSSLCNAATHLNLGANADIEHYRVLASGAGTTHLDTLDIRQSRDSRCKQFTIALGGGLLRTNLDARLDAAGAALDSYALLIGHEQRHVDCVNHAVHAAPATHSRQTARAVASGVSRVVFNSKVTVKAGAAQADSRQSCRGLLLSPTAEIDSRPQLEIHADEVKCAHGATTGRLDPDVLFYMLSRGLDRDTAQSLLVYAFLADVLTGVSVAPLRAAIENTLIEQLPNAQLLRDFQ